MSLKHITFTGIDQRTDLTELQKIQKEYPIAEFGVLTSYHWYENGNRYLNPQIINTLRDKGLNLSLHVCGSATKEALEGRWGIIDKLVWCNIDIFKRIQLNVSGRKNVGGYCYVPPFGGQEVIIQQKGKDDMSLYENTMKIWNTNVIRGTFSVLLDASGGRGVDTGIDVFETENKVGYAGGINPDNIESKLSYLLGQKNIGDFWIDMESGVRNDDWFDLEKVCDVIEKCNILLK